MHSFFLALVSLKSVACAKNAVYEYRAGLTQVAVGRMSGVTQVEALHLALHYLDQKDEDAVYFFMLHVLDAQHERIFDNIVREANEMCAAA